MPAEIVWTSKDGLYRCVRRASNPANYDFERKYMDSLGEPAWFEIILGDNDVQDQLVHQICMSLDGRQAA